MAENVGAIYYTVEARTAALLDAEKDASKSMDNMTSQMGKADKAAGSLNTGMTKLAKAIGAVIAASALRDMAKMVQGYQEMAERVKMATSSQDEYEMVQKRLLATANGTYRSLGEAQELYIRTADSLRAMGYSTAQALDVTDSMSYAFVKNATSADRAQSALSALSKSLNTGKVAADQWETVTAAIPSVINDIATASGKTAAEVRALGASGKLTAKDLSEGLRKSLDENATAAAGMANNLTDAGVRARTALTMVLVSLEEQSGALQTLTNSIITAADMMIEFAGDAGTMGSALSLAGDAATAVAAVIAGRMVMSLMASTKALYASTVGANLKARADLAAAQAGVALAAQELIVARAAEQAAVGLSTHAAAAAALATAQANATAATTTLTAAQRTMSGVTTVATAAMTGLRTVMGFLGGPVGVILLAATALYSYVSAANTAKVSTDELAKAVSTLGTEQLKLQKINLGRDVELFDGKIKKLQKTVENTAKSIEDTGDRKTLFGGMRSEELQAARAELEEMVGVQADRRKREAEINAELERRSKIGSSPSGSGSDALDKPTTTPEGQKRLQQMREEIELAKLTGEARARLQAIQKLGAEATDEERAEAEKLASTLFKLEEAQKNAKGSRKSLTEEQKSAKEAQQELTRAQESDTKTLADLREALYQTTLTTEQLRDRKAELSLSSYATPEQIEEVKRLNAELAKTEDLQKRKDAFGDGSVRDKIMGTVTPLSGGEFDQQTERYEAEAAAEMQRYADQQARLEEALELQLVTKSEYDALQLEMYQQNSDRMAQIDKARTDMQMQTWADGFSDMSRNLEAFASTFASENKAMFAVAKAAAIASATIETITAAQRAFSAMAGIPIVGPGLGVAAAAAAVGAGMARVAQIRSQSMGGGRQYGGPVASGSMYRINENGAPEVFNAANGRQYMLPNQRGEVVSNSDATASAGAQGGRSQDVNVTQNIYMQELPDNRTAKQIQREAYRHQARAKARLG